MSLLSRQSYFWDAHLMSHYHSQKRIGLYQIKASRGDHSVLQRDQLAILNVFI